MLDQEMIDGDKDIPIFRFRKSVTKFPFYEDRQRIF